MQAGLIRSLHALAASTTNLADLKSVDFDSLSKDLSRFSDESRESVTTLQAAPTFLENRRMFTVIVDDIDLTPEDISDPEFKIMEDSTKHAAFQTKVRKDDDRLAKSTQSRLVLTETQRKVYATTINLDDIHIDHTLNTEEGLLDVDARLDLAPSAFYLPKMNPITSYPSHIFVTLKESDTCYIFDLPSVSVDKGTTEGNFVEGDNVYYEYITVGKGRNRKMVNEETQTEETIKQSRHTLATRPQKKNASSFASMWDMHDTYARLAMAVEEEVEDEMVLYQSAAPSMLRKKKKKVVKHIKHGKTYEEIASTPAFYDAVLLTERVIASLQYDGAQKTYRGLIKMDPLSLDLVYIYSMKPLWTLGSSETENVPVTCVCFNSKNPNILAVGHGKFTYAETHSGVVCIWCTKNPCVPERVYRFENPVTSLAFSEKNPNWLGCGFWNGDVIILDITSYTIKTMATSNRDTNPCFDPIWVTQWRTLERDVELVITCCEDGRINKLTNTKTHELLCAPMMRVSTVEGKLKGMEITKACIKMDVPISRHPGVMCMIWHPSIVHIYLVGTSEGCIHKCSTNYLNQHIDVFRAHEGPVYGIELCPFHNNILLSCGADSAVRMWSEGMNDVILTMMCSSAVYGVAFCPINATIIVTVSGNVLSVWDLRRKTHVPCAEYKFPGNLVLTYISFSATGDNIFVGDTLGRVHTFHLEDTPIPAYYQRIMLEDVIKKALCTRPQLLKQLEKLTKFRERTHT